MSTPSWKQGFDFAVLKSLELLDTLRLEKPHSASYDLALDSMRKELISLYDDDSRPASAGGQSITFSPPWWNGDIAIPFSHEQWRHILNALYNILDNGYLWGWEEGEEEIHEDIRRIILDIEGAFSEIEHLS